MYWLRRAYKVIWRLVTDSALAVGYSSLEQIVSESREPYISTWCSTEIYTFDIYPVSTNNKIIEFSFFMSRGTRIKTTSTIFTFSINTLMKKVIGWMCRTRVILRRQRGFLQGGVDQEGIKNRVFHTTAVLNYSITVKKKWYSLNVRWALAGVLYHHERNYFDQNSFPDRATKTNTQCLCQNFRNRFEVNEQIHLSICSFRVIRYPFEIESSSFIDIYFFTILNGFQNCRFRIFYFITCCRGP